MPEPTGARQAHFLCPPELCLALWPPPPPFRLPLRTSDIFQSGPWAEPPTSKTSGLPRFKCKAGGDEESQVSAPSAVSLPTTALGGEWLPTSCLEPNCPPALLHSTHMRANTQVNTYTHIRVYTHTCTHISTGRYTRMCKRAHLYRHVHTSVDSSHQLQLLS